MSRATACSLESPARIALANAPTTAGAAKDVPLQRTHSAYLAIADRRFPLGEEGADHVDTRRARPNPWAVVREVRRPVRSECTHRHDPGKAAGYKGRHVASLPADATTIVPASGVCVPPRRGALCRPRHSRRRTGSAGPAAVRPCARRGVENSADVVLAHVAVTGQGPLHTQPARRGDPLDDARDERAVAGHRIDTVIVVCVGLLVGDPLTNTELYVDGVDTAQGPG